MLLLANICAGRLSNGGGAYVSVWKKHNFCLLKNVVLNFLWTRQRYEIFDLFFFVVQGVAEKRGVIKVYFKNVAY